MRFKATESQLRHLLATAVNASSPAGLGHLHYTPRTFTADDFADATHGADYVEGRMVKLYPRKVGDDIYEIGEPQYDAADPERTYQSWGAKYPTARALIEAAGLEIVQSDT